VGYSPPPSSPPALPTLTCYNQSAQREIKFPITDRYLTLVSTDGGNGINCDLITFIDPQLQLSDENYRPASPSVLSPVK
jgi:hypothetical protein